MGKPQAPESPDPQETSAAQTGTNVSTALANTLLGNVSQYGPDGSSLVYNQTGDFDFTDPYTNQTYTLPQFSATTSLSPEAQAIYRQNQAAQQNLADLSVSQSGFLKDYLGQTPNFDTSAIENRLYDLAAQRLDPRMERERAQMETRLANQGLVPGSAAYDAEMGNFGQYSNDAYTQLMLQGRGQAFNELAAQRSQPINEITALLSGSQVAMPQYPVNMPSGIPTTDNAGLINNAYDQEYKAYSDQMSQWNSTIGGLFGLGAALISDRRLKRDVVRRGSVEGFPVYDYNYVWEPETAPARHGFMAQDVAEIRPEAVREVAGFLVLDMAQLPEVA